MELPLLSKHTKMQKGEVLRKISSRTNMESANPSEKQTCLLHHRARAFSEDKQGNVGPSGSYIIGL